MLVGVRFHRLTAYAQIVKMSCYASTNAVKCCGINKCCESMEIPTKCHDLALKIACDPITEKCITKECDDCPSLDMEAL